MSRRKVLYKSIDPQDYFRIVDKLSLMPESCAQRTAADRIYYATFLFCRDSLSSKNYIIPKHSVDDHSDVQYALRRKEVLSHFGNEEYRLRRARNCVTYDDNNDLIEGKSRDALSIDWMLSIANEIIKRVEALPMNPNKLQ